MEKPGDKPRKLQQMLHERIEEQQQEKTLTKLFRDYINEKIQSFASELETEPDKLVIFNELFQELNTMLEKEDQLRTLTVWKKGTRIVMPESRKHFPHREAKNPADKPLVESLEKEMEGLQEKTATLFEKVSSDYPGEYLLMEDLAKRFSKTGPSN